MSLRRLSLIVSGLLAAGLTVAGCAATGPGAAAASDGFNDPLDEFAEYR